MKQVVRVVIFTLVALFVCNNSMAQYAYQPMGDNPFQTEIGQGSDPIELTKGDKYLDAGRGILFSGLSLAATIFSTYVYSSIGYEPDPDMPGSGAGEVATLFATGLGGTIALFSIIPFSVGNKSNNGAGPLIYDGDNRGYGKFIEVGVGMPCWVNVDAVAGYYLTNNIFVGAGAGIDMFLVDEKHPEERLLPVYANARFAWGDRRVTPYFSGSYGWDCNSRRPYSALEFGTRFRNSKNWDNSLWLGFKSEFRGVGELCGFSLKCGWSF